MTFYNSIPYNPDIADVFYRVGYIKTWGQGIQKICDECIALGAELPRYEILGTGIRVREAGRVIRVGGKRYGHWEVR